MTYLHDRVYDNGLSVLPAEGNKAVICSQEPATFPEANSTYRLGEKTSITISAPGARSPNGRKVTMSAITGGTVTANGTATHWAIVDTTNSRLLAAQSLQASQVVNTANPFSLTAADIGIPGPA